MEGHQMPFVNRLDGARQGIPHFSADVPLDIATHYPNDVRTVLVSVGEERAISLCLCLVHESRLDKSSPDAHHSDIDAVGCGLVDDEIHVLPVAIAFLGVNR